jgi:hypothetical protein
VQVPETARVSLEQVVPQEPRVEEQHVIDLGLAEGVGHRPLTQRGIARIHRDDRTAMRNRAGAGTARPIGHDQREMLAEPRRQQHLAEHRAAGRGEHAEAHRARDHAATAAR